MRNKTLLLACRHLAICKFEVLRACHVILLIFTISIGYSQSYTLDWSDYRIEQNECGISNTSSAAAVYDDLDQSQLQFGQTRVSFSHGPEENTFCASGKIRRKNGGQTHVYSATLDGQTKEDCSWMIMEFSEPVQNVAFDLIDVDVALLYNWQDELTFSPTWTHIENNANLNIDHSLSQINGVATCDSEINDCNSRLFFEGPLTTIRIDYCYGSATSDNFPDRQIYNIGDIEFEHYELEAAIYIDENCPGTESMITIQDQLLLENEILEIAFADYEGMINEVKQYDEAGIYNLEIPIVYTSCGEFLVSVRVLDDPTTTASTGEQILNHNNSNLYTLSITDNERPTFPADQQDIMYLRCDQEIPHSYFRAARDNCLEPIDINQEVWEEYLEFNEECGQWNMRRYWLISDFCGNQTIDSIDYIYLYDENVRGLGDAEDLVEACNVFSPNGDGINDFFAIYLGNLNIESSEFYVFDRSGNPRYQEMNMLGERAVSNFGGDLRYGSWTSGVYVWMLKLTDPYGKTTIISREVTVLL